MLPECTADARQSVYRRARAILDTSMQDADPPIEGERIEEERARLEQVIAEVEAQFVSSIEPQRRRLRRREAALAVAPAESRRSAAGPPTAPVRRRRVSQARRRGPAVRRRRPDDPAILEFQRPSAAIVNVPMPLSAAQRHLFGFDLRRRDDRAGRRHLRRSSRHGARHRRVALADACWSSRWKPPSCAPST